MASVQVRGKAEKKSYRVQFYFHGRRQSLKLGGVSERAANAKAAKVEEVLGLLERGIVQLPPGMDVLEFVKHDGKPPAEPVVRFGATLGVLRDRYLAACRGSLFG